MPAGRKPKPTWIKLITGNPGRRPLNKNEPLPDSGVGPPPDGFSEPERLVWLGMVNSAPAGLLTQMERPLLADYCRSRARCDDYTAKVAKFGSVVKTRGDNWIYSPYYTQMKAEEKTCKGILIELGYTPSARSRVAIAAKRKGAAETPFDDLKTLTE